MDTQGRPNAVFRQSVAACAASMSVLASATIYAWVTPLLPGLLGPASEIPMTEDEASWMVALIDFGALLSPVPGGILADYIGRKTLILLSAPLLLFGWIIVLYFRTLLVLIIARIIQGLAIGIVYTVLPIYLGEIAIPKYRGTVTSMFYCFWWFGYLFEYVLGPYMSFNSFTLVTASVNVVFFIVFLWPPESPYFYLMKNEEEKARKSLIWLFCTTEEETKKELDRMREGTSKKKVAWKALVDNAPNRKALMIVLLNGYARIFCGLMPLSSYSTLTLDIAGGESFLSPDSITIVMGIMMFVGSICSAFTLDIFGRKPLLLFSSSVSGITMLLVGIFYYCDSNTTLDVSSFNWVPSIGLIIFSAVSVLGVFPVSIAYQSELFDSSTRGTASIVLNVYTTVLCILIYKYYLTILQTFGTFVNFYIFAVTCFISFVSSFVMPETKGKSFEQIRHELHKGKIKY